MSKNKKGILFAAISAIVFSTGGLLTKLITLNSLSIVSGRCIFSSLFIVIYFILSKRKFVLNKTTIMGGILVMLNMATYVIANKLTTAANPIILEYTAPAYIILFSLLFLHQKPTKLKIFTVLSVLIGIVLVMAGSINAGNMLGNMIAAINGAIYGLQMMINDFEGGDSVTSVCMGHILCIFVGLPSLLSETNITFSLIILIALFGLESGLGYLMMALATKNTEALTVSLVSYIEPILNPIWVVLFYGESISLITILGIIIVMGTIVYYTYQTNIKKA